MESSIDNQLFEQRQFSFSFKAILINVLIGILVSLYYFPFEFTFLPRGLNTKIMLAGLGIFVLAYNCIRQRCITVNKGLVPAIILALIFSLLGYISMDINLSTDSSYANYFVSFGTWLLGAYTVIELMKIVYHKVSFTLLINYLVGICVVQCFLALLIDNNLQVKTFVDAYIAQDTIASVEVLNKINRLYGIGAALDVAGTRFSIVLLGLAVVLRNLNLRNPRLGAISIYWGTFIIIGGIGNMISRTTTVGIVLALTYLMATSISWKIEITRSSIKYWLTIFLITVLLISVGVYLYNTDDTFHDQVRFGFEGFFNWYETGEWTTDSTERLNGVMWIWPAANDYKTWIIGKATFDNWYAVGTDIGYCRFVFYNGLLGLITFSLFFVYNAWAGIKKFPNYKLFFLILLSLSFIIWLKVATDLFLIYALFYCLDSEEVINA